MMGGVSEFGSMDTSVPFVYTSDAKEKNSTGRRKVYNA